MATIVYELHADEHGFFRVPAHLHQSLNLQPGEILRVMAIQDKLFILRAWADENLLDQTLSIAAVVPDENA